MAFDLTGKRALLAGTADDLLANVATALAGAGARIIPTAASSLETPDPEILRRQIEDAGGVELFIYNAGWRHHAAFLDHAPGDWDAALAANFETPTLLAQAVARQMIAQGNGGRILFLSGFEGMMPFEGTAAAGTTLTMLSAMARMMAVDLAPHRITVNVLAVGWLEGERYASLPPEVQGHIVAGIPSGRVGLPADVASAVAFLASDMAAYLTGLVLPVDGGYLLTRSTGKTLLER